MNGSPQQPQLANDSGFHHIHRAVVEGVDFADPAAGVVRQFRIGHRWVDAGPEHDVALEVDPYGQFGIRLPACPDCGGTLVARVAGRTPGTYECAGEGRWFADGTEAWFDLGKTPTGDRAGCGSRFVHNLTPPWADQIADQGSDHINNKEAA